MKHLIEVRSGLVFMPKLICFFFLVGCSAIPNKQPIISDPMPSRHQIKAIYANGLQFGYIEKGEGPLVLLLHGFPENAGTFDTLIDRIAAEGFRAVAPFTRGYFPTEIPSNNDYCMATLGRDILALIDSFNESEAIVVGHDWGGSAAYAAANINPQKIKKIVSIASVHPRNIKFNPNAIYKARHILLFQFPKISDKIVRSNNFAYIEKLYKRWSPGWQIPDDQLEKNKAGFASDTRLEAALSYYRSALDPSCDPHILRKSTEVPTLIFSGAADGAMTESAFRGLENSFTGYFQHIRLKDGGHFMHHEFPDLLFTEMNNFFNLEIPATDARKGDRYIRRNLP